MTKSSFRITLNDSYSVLYLDVPSSVQKRYAWVKVVTGMYSPDSHLFTRGFGSQDYTLCHEKQH